MNKSIAPLMKKTVATGLVGIILPLSGGVVHAAGLPLIGSLHIGTLSQGALGLLSTAPAKAVLDTAAGTAGAVAGAALQAEGDVAVTALGAAEGVLETAVGVAGAGLGVAMPVVQDAVGQAAGLATGALGAAVAAAPVLQPVAPVVEAVPGTALNLVGTVTGLVTAAPETATTLVADLHGKVIGLAGAVPGKALGLVGTVQGIALGTGDDVLLTVGNVVKGVPVATIGDDLLGQATSIAGPLVGIVTAVPAKGLEVVNLPVAALKGLDPAGILRILTDGTGIDVPVSAILNAGVAGNKVLGLRLP